MLLSVMFTLLACEPNVDCGVAMMSQLAGSSSETDFTLNTESTRTTGYLFRLQNNGVDKVTVQNDGTFYAPYVSSPYLFGSYLIARGSGGVDLQSNRYSSDTSSDFYFHANSSRAGAMLEGVAGSTFGIWQILADGSFHGGRQNGTGAFVESSGVADSMANRTPALTCQPGGTGNCFLTLTGHLANNGFHGTVTIVNETDRDAGTGLMLQIGSKEHRSDAPAMDHGHYTTLALSDPGDLVLYGGTVNPYFSAAPPACSSGGPNPLGGVPTSGAVAWSGSASELQVCRDGEWATLARSSSVESLSAQIVALQARVTALEALLP